MKVRWNPKTNFFFGSLRELLHSSLNILQHTASPPAKLYTLCKYKLPENLTGLVSYDGTFNYSRMFNILEGNFNTYIISKLLNVPEPYIT